MQTVRQNGQLNSASGIIKGAGEGGELLLPLPHPSATNLSYVTEQYDESLGFAGVGELQ